MRHNPRGGNVYMSAYCELLETTEESGEYLKPSSKSFPNGESIFDFKTICRLCISECSPSKSSKTCQARILDMIEFCLSLNISEADGLPSNICSSCLDTLEKFYTFKKKIEDNDRKLRIALTKKENKLDIPDIAPNEAEIVDEIIDEIPINYLENNIVNNNDLNGLSSYGCKIGRKGEDTSLKEILGYDQNLKLQEHCYDKEDKIVENIHSKINYNNLKVPPLMPLREKVSPSTIGFITLAEEPPPLIPLRQECINSNEIGNILERNLQCINCEKRFNTLNQFKVHKQICISSTSLVCNICKKEYKERKKLIGHLKGHIITKDYACKICEKRYPNPSTFKIHMRSHTGEKPFRCSICDKGFTRMAGVLSHKQTHDNFRPFKCETCGKSFKILSNLERHKVLHSSILPFCCNYCGKTFSQSDNLQLHIKTYHTNERPYLCSECGKRFVSSTRLNRHMWVHTGFKPFPCNLCSKAYSNSSDLKNHQRGAHGNGKNDKPYACNICDMKFFHACRLSKHIKTHQRPFACCNCDKTFGSDNVLEKHVKSKHASVIQ